jgi:geranylgeranyl pyrophosphate synthase
MDAEKVATFLSGRLAATRPRQPARDVSALAVAYAEPLALCRAELDAVFRPPALSVVPDRQRYGKLVRALMMFVASRVVGIEPRSVVKTAAAVELMHTASLVHDDLVDGSSTRRGLPSLHAQVGLPRALVLGDHMLMSAVGLVADAADGFPADRAVSTVAALARAATRCACGELADIAAGPVAGSPAVAVDKAGALFAFAASAPALLAGAERTHRVALERFGVHIGVAYQARDDWLDRDADGHSPSVTALGTSTQLCAALHELRALPESTALSELEVIARFATTRLA